MNRSFLTYPELAVEIKRVTGYKWLDDLLSSMFMSATMNFCIFSSGVLLEEVVDKAVSIPFSLSNYETVSMFFFNKSNN